MLFLSFYETQETNICSDERKLTGVTSYDTATRGLACGCRVQEYPWGIGGEKGLVWVESILVLYFSTEWVTHGDIKNDERKLTALTPFDSVKRGLVGGYVVQEFPGDIGGEITVVCVEAIVGLFF